MGRKRKSADLEISCTLVSPATKKPKKEKFEKEKRYNIELKPLTRNQDLFIQSLQNNIISIGYGSAGSGKTFLSAMYAAQQVSLGNFEKIIISRPAIATGKSLGFFPGTIEEKMMPWIQQIVNYLKQFLGSNVVNNWLHGEYQKIILEPMETLRGRNFENCIVIIDESQQLSIDEFKCITTRVGKNCKLILCGDPKQKDVKERGLDDFVLLIEKHNVRNIGAVKFGIDDIVRSDIVKDLIVMFEYEGL